MSQLTITKSLSAKYKPDYVKGDIDSLEKQIAGLQKKQTSKKVEEELKRVEEKLREKQADLERFSYPAHKILADRMAERDPGNAPASGERIGFIYVSPSAGQLAPKLQGDRIETPSFIRDKGLKPDFRYYIEHQLMNPLGQLFGLIVEQIPGFSGGSSLKLESQRETLAIDLLFAKALGECDKQAMREFATQHLGANILVSAPAQSVRKSPHITDLSGNVTKQSQSLMTSFLKPVDPAASYMVTKAIVESGKKQKEEKKKEEKKKEEAPKKKRASKSVSVDA
jgi:hypothetical protein